MEQYLLGPYLDKSNTFIPSSGPMAHHLLDMLPVYHLISNRGKKQQARAMGGGLANVALALDTVWG
jgi:hypothetical protein